MNRIKQLRISKGVKQITFANDMGVAQSAISQWENGKSLPAPDKLKKISEYFNVSMEYLLGDEDISAVDIRVIE